MVIIQEEDQGVDRMVVINTRVLIVKIMEIKKIHMEIIMIIKVD